MRATPLRFGLTLLIGFAVLMGGFEALRGTAFERAVVVTGILKPTVALIDVVTPEEHVRRVGRVLISSYGPSLRVTRGCEGIEMLLLLMAALVAFPASLRWKAQGLLWGALLAFVLSVSRLMALYYVLRYSPSLWEMLHGFVLPLAPIVLLSIYFLWWSSLATAGQAGSVNSRPAPGSAAF